MIKHVIISIFALILSGCTSFPLDGQWQFIAISDPGKITYDYNKILFNISSTTRKFMQETGIKDSSDSLIIPADIFLTIQYYRSGLIKLFGKRMISGDLGCGNKFKIRYLSGGGKIFFKEIAMTRLPCHSDNNFLFMYREYLFASNEYFVSHDSLYLKNLYSNEMIFKKIRD